MNRHSFLTYEDVLRQLAELCCAKASDLELRAKQANARYEEALRGVVDKQRNLADVLCEYADTGPAEFLHTRLQFADELLTSSDDSPETVGDALQNLMRRNSIIERVFADHAESAAPEGLADLLGNLSDLFAAHSRAVAQNLEQARDM